MVMYSIIAGYLFFFVIGWISDTVGFNNSGYALRDKDILFRRGWLIRKIRVVPLNRVQHVSIQSGPIERRYQLSSVSIFTAGSGAADFTIHGLTIEKAAQIKEWISNQLNGPAVN
jgi:membrane protein YdbS with pleckstrin-like domain